MLGLDVLGCTLATSYCDLWLAQATVYGTCWRTHESSADHTCMPKTEEGLLCLLAVKTCWQGRSIEDAETQEQVVVLYTNSPEEPVAVYVSYSNWHVIFLPAAADTTQNWSHKVWGICSYTALPYRSMYQSWTATRHAPTCGNCILNSQPIKGWSSCAQSWLGNSPIHLGAPQADEKTTSQRLWVNCLVWQLTLIWSWNFQACCWC